MSTNLAQATVIEALDAGGSQSQTDLLVKRLKKEKLQTHQYHFPQEDTATGRLIYDKFLLHKNKQPFSKREQALLYIQDFFSKADEMHSIITGKAKKQIIVSDRFMGSTLAYQTIGLTGKKREVMKKWITWLCYEGTPVLPKPDAVIFLDTPVEVSLKRLSDKKKDFFETKEKLTAIRNSYLKVAKEHKWHVIPSVNKEGEERTRPDLHKEIWQIVEGVIR